MEIIKTFNLPGKEEIKIGCSSGCDVCIEDPSIAPEQAILLLKQDGFHLQLITHIPPVFVTGERVEGDVRLEDGDTIRIEDYDLILNVLPDEIPEPKELVEPEKKPAAEPGQPEQRQEIPEVKPPAPEPVAETPIPPQPGPTGAEVGKDDEKVEPQRGEEAAGEAKQAVEEQKQKLEQKPEPQKQEPAPSPEEKKSDDIHYVKTQEINLDQAPEPPKEKPKEEPKAAPPEPNKKPPVRKEPPVPEKPAEKEPPPQSGPEPGAEQPKQPEPAEDSRKTKVLSGYGGEEPPPQPQSQKERPRPEPEELDWFLVAVDGPLKGKKFKLKKDLTKIGRDRKQNDIVIRLDSEGELDKSISREHARIEYSNGRYYLSDPASQMRTKINQREMDRDEKVQLKPRDIIHIMSMKDDTVFRVCEEGDLDYSPPDPARVTVSQLGVNRYVPFLIGAVALLLIAIILIMVLK